MTLFRSMLKWSLPALFVFLLAGLSLEGSTRASSMQPPLPTPPPEVGISQAEQDRVREMILALETQGLEKMNVPEYHARGLKGAGVSIAVLDVGFTGITKLIKDGELPPDVVRLTYDGDTGKWTEGVDDIADDPDTPCDERQSHGTAVAEVVYDIAPEAKLYVVHLKNSNATNMRALLEKLRDEGVRIVSASLSWPIWRGDGRGPGYDLFETARRDFNMLFIESAGNYARSFYSATFTDTDYDNLHEFKQGWLGTTIKEDEQNRVYLPKCGHLSVELEWDDWGNDPQNPAPASKYDLVLRDPNGTEVARGEPSDYPGMASAPYRWFNFEWPGGAQSYLEYEIEIVGYANNQAQRKLRLMIRGTYSDGGLERYAEAGSLSAYGDSEFVFSVAAASVRDEKLESYSSRGRTTDRRIKPDITGYANVATASYANNAFNGTSAAAPHVAGAAVLMLQTHPGATADELARLLEGSAAGKGSPGKDTQFGAGLVRLPALQLALNILAPTTAAPDFVGAPAAPSKTLIDVSATTGTGEQWAGLGAADFAVSVGGRAATVTTVRKTADRYLLEIVPPTQSAPGLYDLIVSAGGQSDVEAGALRYADLGANQVDVMLVLDRSGSMGGRPMTDARNAAILFVDLMKQGDSVGVGSYASSSSLNYPLTAISDASIQTAAANAIRAISSAGNTSIGAGLITGRDQLLGRGDDNHSWAIVLLSDGQENSSPYVSSVLPTIKSTKIKVFSVGLGSVNESLMNSIATETGGSYFFTPNSAELAGIYNSISGQVAGRQTLFSLNGSVIAGQTVTHWIDVDSTVKEAIFSVSWNSGGSELDLVLHQPNGRRIDAAVAASDPAIDLVMGATYRYYVVRNPMAGAWWVDVKGIKTAATSRATDSIGAEVAGEAYVFSAQATTNLTLDLITANPTYATGQPIHLLMSLAADRPVIGAKVIAVVTRPDGEQELIELMDDGNNGDNVADDGTYGGRYYRVDRTGTYRFNVTADGTISDRMFTRMAEMSVAVSAAPDADRDGMPDEWEYWNGLDPLRNDAAEDPDFDKLVNLDEYRYGSSPGNSDVDGDGLLDGDEVHDFGTNPLMADTDMGGVDDGDEIARGTNPLDPGDDPGSRFALIPMSVVIPPAPVAYPLLNGDFESGSSGWKEYSEKGLKIIYAVDEVAGLPVHSGRRVAWLGGFLNETSYIEQRVTVPADKPYLTFYYVIISDDACGNDKGGVLIDSVTRDVIDLCRATTSRAWQRRVIDLSAYAGRVVTLQLRARTNGSLNSNLFIDDVSFSASGMAREEGVPVGVDWAGDRVTRQKPAR